MRAIITGASSGIGLELARELAKRGYALALLARRTDLLEELARELQSGAGDLAGRSAAASAAGRPVAGGTAGGAPAPQARAVAIGCDVTDAASVRDAVRRGESELGGAFDLAIANAGISIPGHATKFKLDEAEQVIRVNLLGMLYLFDAVIPSMVERRAGRFVGVASVAGLRGLPVAGAYSASKAAMQSFLEASRVELAPYGVGVTIVNPGFVATAMTEKNRFRMPFLMNADRAARIIANGIERGKRVVEFPFGTSLFMRTARLLPDALYDRMMAPMARRKIDPAKVKR